MQRGPCYKLAVFDLDGTLTKERSIWEYIHLHLGKWHGFADDYQKRFLKGEISYEEFCELDADVWKGMRIEEFIAIIKTVPFHDGIGELVDFFKKKGLKIAVVSSGLSLLSSWVHEKYGFDYSISNDLLHDEGILTGKVKIHVRYDKKAEWVERILKEFGIRPDECIAIGDSLGDLDMFQLVGFSVAVNSSCKDLEKVASVCVKGHNLAEIIPRLPF